MLSLATLFAFALILLGSWPISKETRGEGIQGGPAKTRDQKLYTGELLGMVMSSPKLEAVPLKENEEKAEVFAGALKGPGVLTVLASKTPTIYKVGRGETIAVIAQKFGVTAQTIISSNPKIKNRALREGQELLIPPVSGMLYTLKEGETPETIAQGFSVPISRLKDFNVNFASVSSGSTLIIPGVSAKENSSVPETGPLLKDYFEKPAEGLNWGRLHPDNAVDIANSCGTSVMSSAEGLVTEVAESGWNGGYGNFAKIEHPNGTKTKYTHLQSLSVSVGDYVKSGELIGKMGKSGEASGCHLHFEIEGAKNPFAR